MDRRNHPRFQTRFEALCSSGREEAEGVLSDLSYSGAQLVGGRLQPPIGTKVRLYVLIEPVEPFQLVGSVVRHIDDGFAIEFSRLDPEIERLVDDVAAIVGAP